MGISIKETLAEYRLNKKIYTKKCFEPSGYFFYFGGINCEKYKTVLHKCKVNDFEKHKI